MTYRTYLSVGLRALAVAACLSLASYASQASASTVYGIDDLNNLFTFDHLAPSNITNGVFLSGLSTNERLVGIDFRPADGVLYGIGSTKQVYTVNPATGVCTAVGTGFGPVSGNSFGVDFNPAADKIRFVSDTNASVRVNPFGVAPQGGLFATDTDLAYLAGPDPNVVGVAYTNSVNPAPATTTLYGIDSNTNTLVRIGGVNGTPSPNAGQLTTIGPLGVDADNFVGFDISTANATDFAIASLASGGNSSLYFINLATGAASNLGQIIGGVRVVDIALTPGQVFNLPEPSTIVMVVLGGLGMCAIRRRKAAK